MRNRISAPECASKIRAARRVVALTGAGISTAAGVPDFRGPEGIYASGRYDLEETFTIFGFLRRPSAFYRFAREIMGELRDVRPTFAHRFLAELEERGRLTAVITQNVDSLHRDAGSRNVIAVHGDFSRSRCLSCDRALEVEELTRMLEEMEVPRCACGGLIKPDVVFFGEAVRGLDEATATVAGADLLLVLGSSLTVEPAASLPQCASGEVVVVNRGPVGLPPAPNRHFADADLDGFLGEVAAAL